MSAPSNLISHGAADPVNDLADEDNLDVTEFKAKHSREKRETKNRFGNVRKVQFFNPIVAISLSAFVIGRAGLADLEPGTRVTALVNYASTRHGHDPSVGTMMLDDAEDTLSLEEDLKTSYNITHCPFVITA